MLCDVIFLIFNAMLRDTVHVMRYTMTKLDAIYTLSTGQQMTYTSSLNVHDLKYFDLLCFTSLNSDKAVPSSLLKHPQVFYDIFLSPSPFPSPSLLLPLPYINLSPISELQTEQRILLTALYNISGMSKVASIKSTLLTLINEAR